MKYSDSYAIILLIQFCAFGVASAKADDLIVSSTKIRIVENGGFIQKTLKELGSEEAQVALVATCAYFGADCSKAAVVLGEVKRQIKKSGEEHRGSIFSPEGYVLCKAGLKVHSHDGGTTFNSTYRSNDDGLGDRIDFYAVVPQRTKKRAIDMTISLEYAKPKDREKYGCVAPPQAALWECPHNWVCSNKAPTQVKIVQPKP